MRKTTAIIVAYCASYLSLSAWAADQNPQAPQSVQSASQSAQPQQLLGEIDYWIDPDRPHIADSSVNVPKGLMLQENGFQQSYSNSHSGIFDFSET